MGQAAKLLKQLQRPEPSKKPSGDKLVVLGSAPVTLLGRQTTAKAAARYYRIINKRIKSMETELTVLKDAIRRVGQEQLEVAFCDGKYYSAVDVGGVKVTRANKYSPIQVDPAALREAVGEAYGAMFQEDCALRFDSLGEMQQHVRACELAGVELRGKQEVSVKGRSGLSQRLCEMWDGLDSERKELLMACAKDQQPRVGGK